MGDDTIYTDGSPELFDAASDLLMDKVRKSRKVKDKQIYDLLIKATDYYREYLQQNQPFDPSTVLTIPASRILRMDVSYSSSGNVVRMVEYVDK